MSFSLPPKTAVIGFLTTKSTEWSLRRRQLSTQWINHGNGYHVELGEKDEPPLKYQGFIAPATGGSVERHHCTKIDKEVAVKRLQTHSNPETNRKLRDEVKILRMLQHYHVVQVYGSYIHQDCFNILMVPVATCNLRTYLQEPASSKVKMMERAYGARILLLPKIMGCLAHGLKYLHTVPKIRHKDIKPANILLEGPRVLFADFGCSKVFTDTQSGTTGPTSKTPMVRLSPSKSEAIGLIFTSIHLPRFHLGHIETSPATFSHLHVSSPKSLQSIKDALRTNFTAIEDRQTHKRKATSAGPYQLLSNGWTDWPWKDAMCK